MSEGSTEDIRAIPDYKAKLVRERFEVTPIKKNGEREDVRIAMANRLNFTCFDNYGQKKSDFIVRAQNIHTALRIGARVAQQWYDYGHMHKTGKNRFNWEQVYADATKDYEQRWNPDCWASVYKNGHLIFQHSPAKNSEILNIIEQVFAHEKCAYQHIPWIAQRLFEQAGRTVEIDYDSNIAMELMGDDGSIKSHILHRDIEGRSEVQLDMLQKTSRYIKGAKGAKVKLHECLDVAAIVFEGLQHGFVVGKCNYDISSGQIKIGHRNAVQSDHALRRIKQLDSELNKQKTLHQLLFKPKPDFYAHIQKIERSFNKFEQTPA